MSNRADSAPVQGAWEALVRLRNEKSPDNEAHLAAEVNPLVLRYARRYGADEDAAQNAWAAVVWKADQCRAAQPAEFSAWIRVVVRNRTSTSMKPGRDVLGDEPVVDPADPRGDDPEDRASANAMLEAVGRARRAAERMRPERFGRRERDVARRLGIGLKAATWRRDVRILIRLRVDGESAERIGAPLGLSPPAVRQAAVRGALRVGFAAALLARDEADPWRRSALLEIATRAIREVPTRALVA